MRSKIFWWVLLAAAISFFAVSVSTRAEVPAAQDELCWLGGVDSLHETGTAWDVYNPGEKIVYSPHLYLRMLQLSYIVCGPSLSSARWPGLLAGLLSLAFVCAITMRVVEGDRRRRWAFGVMATLLCCSIPAFVQGCAIIDIDNTILGPLLLALVWTGQRLTERPTMGRALAVAGVTALVLWARFTTPLVLFPILAFFAWFAEDRRARWMLPLALVAGVVTFLATWGGYCALTATPFSGPFAYTWAAFADRAGGGAGRLGVARLAANGTHLVLWFGLVACVAVGVVLFARAIEFVRERKLRPSDPYLLCGLAIVGGYTVVGGTPFGFPKYHCPGLPMLAVATLAGASRFRWREGAVQPAAWLATLATSALIQVVLAGDLIRVVRVTLRESQAMGSDARVVASAAATAVGIAGLAWILLTAAHWIADKRRTWGPSLLALAIGSGVGTIGLQNAADSSTGYSYGAEGTRAVARLLDRELERGARCVAPSEVLYLMEQHEPVFVDNEMWTDAAALESRLRDPENVAYVISIQTNTVAQLRTGLENRGIEDVLTEQYVARRVGEYRVWVRRRPASQKES